MSSKLRSTLKGIAILVVILCILMELDYLIIPALYGYKFWMMTGAFILSLLSSR